MKHILLSRLAWELLLYRLASVHQLASQKHETKERWLRCIPTSSVSSKKEFYLQPSLSFLPLATDRDLIFHTLLHLERGGGIWHTDDPVDQQI